MSAPTGIDVVPAEPVAAAVAAAPDIQEKPHAYPPQSPRDSGEDEKTSSPSSTAHQETERDKDGEYAGKEKKEVVDLQPCSIGELFRFATPAEKAANLVSLIAAAAAGAAQVRAMPHNMIHNTDPVYSP